jgi:hypothetical protein
LLRQLYRQKNILDKPLSGTYLLNPWSRSLLEELTG